MEEEDTGEADEDAAASLDDGEESDVPAGDEAVPQPEGRPESDRDPESDFEAAPDPADNDSD